MSKTLHLPDGDKVIPSEAEVTAAEKRELQFKEWISQAKSFETSLIPWSQVTNDDQAQYAMDMVGEFATSFVMARILHASAQEGRPPASVGISLQVRTFDEDENMIQDVEVDLSKPEE